MTVVYNIKKKENEKKKDSRFNEQIERKKRVSYTSLQSQGSVSTF